MDPLLARASVFRADSPRLIGWRSLDRPVPTSDALCRRARTARATPNRLEQLGSSTRIALTMRGAPFDPRAQDRSRSLGLEVSEPLSRASRRLAEIPGNPRSKSLRAFSRKDLRTRFTLIPTRLSSKTPRPKSRAEPSSRAPEGGTTARMRRTDAVQSTLSKTGTRHSRGYRFAAFPRQPDESRAFTTRTRFGPQARPHRSAFSSDSGAMSA
jgi:hypothetical protein